MQVVARIASRAQYAGTTGAVQTVEQSGARRHDARFRLPRWSVAVVTLSR